MTIATNHASVLAEVVGIVRQAAKVPLHLPIRADSRLVEDLAIDSLGLVGVILEIQDHFDVVIDEDAVPNLCRVADIVAYLAAQK